MRAAIIEAEGAAPQLRKIHEPLPDGDSATIRVYAAPLNPLDAAVASGSFGGGRPAFPYVPGCEAVGTVVDSANLPQGLLVWVLGDGLGYQRNGTLAEHVTVNEDWCHPVPVDVDPILAAASGMPAVTGWLATTQRARVRAGDRVLVLGATGAVGSAAIQAARLAGAQTVVAVGRSETRLKRAGALGADITVPIDSNLRSALESAFPAGIDVVIDPLGGEFLEIAVDLASPGARIVHLGASVGPSAHIDSAPLRGKALDILGFSVFRTSTQERSTALQEIGTAILSKDFVADHHRYEAEQASLAWEDLMLRSGSRPVVAFAHDE